MKIAKNGPLAQRRTQTTYLAATVDQLQLEMLDDGRVRAILGPVIWCPL